MAQTTHKIPHTVAYTFTHVIKRNEQLKPFDIDRIEQAVYKAFLDTGEAGLPEAKLVAHAVGDQLEIESAETGGENYTPHVEHVQDLVERELMTQGYVVTAKSYILFRQERAQRRAKEEAENLARVEKSDLDIVLRDGTKARFDISRIQEHLQACAQDFPDVDVPEMLGALKHALYDGISIPEINEAMVMIAKARIERDPSYSQLASRILINEIYKRVVGFNEFDEGFAEAHAAGLEAQMSKGVEQKRYDARMIELFDFAKLGAALDTSRDSEFEYRGIRVLWDRYIIKDTEQEFLETPQYFWMRVAMGLSLLEKDPTEAAIKFYNLVSQMLYVPSSPTLIHAGQPRAQMSSCYLNYVSDDLTHIFKVIGDNAQMSKWSGGIGTSWTNIRATNSVIKTINQPSQGLIPFLKIVDSTTASINRSGKRRGAVAVYLENWHLDFEYFLDLRKNTGDDRRRTHDINTVGWISDLFMKRVEAGAVWTMFSPDETPDLHDLYGKAFEERYIEYEAMADRGEIALFKRVEAKTLWRKMISMLFETGHPWITFKDPSNVRSPQDHVGVVHSSNLCTEITLNTSEDETAVCNLGSVCLWRHLDAEQNIDREKMAETIATAMHMIDTVVDINFYPTPEAENANTRHRPVGLGIMGFQDVLFRKRMPFDSDEAVQLSDELMEFVSYHAILNSSKMAKEKGAYSTFEGSKWDRGLFPVDTIKLLEEERGMSTGIEPTESLDWAPVRAAVKEHGMRNSNTMAIAPTATIGNISGSLPSIEPIYKNLYVKSNFSGEFTVINEYLVKELKSLGLWNSAMLEKLKHYDGSIQNIAGIPDELKNLFKEVFEIDSSWVIKHAARRQKWIDQSQSLNIFMKTQSGRAISDVYFDAWRSGLKTTYYLRSLGATAIEKSTVDINKKHDETDQKVTTTAPSTPKLHVYTDETCESCQ